MDRDVTPLSNSQWYTGATTPSTPTSMVEVATDAISSLPTSPVVELTEEVSYTRFTTGIS